MDVARKILVLFIAFITGGFFASRIVLSTATQDFHIFYSLDGKRNDREIVRLIDAADSFLYFGMYEFTKKDIAEALLRAKARGVAVRGIMDRGQSARGAQADVVAMLRGAGIPIEFQKHATGIMHLKLIVTDHAYALGSYNWTSSATFVNDEILEVGTAEPLREQYLHVITGVLTENQ